MKCTKDQEPRTKDQGLFKSITEWGSLHHVLSTEVGALDAFQEDVADSLNNIKFSRSRLEHLILGQRVSQFCCGK